MDYQASPDVSFLSWSQSVTAIGSKTVSIVKYYWEGEGFLCISLTLRLHAMTATWGHVFTSPHATKAPVLNPCLGGGWSEEGSHSCLYSQQRITHRTFSQNSVQDETLMHLLKSSLLHAYLHENPRKGEQKPGCLQEIGFHLLPGPSASSL